MGRFLKENSRYARCFALSPDDYKGWTQNIEQAGYATGGELSLIHIFASPARTSLTSAKHIYWFESAYDAMAYYQIHRCV